MLASRWFRFLFLSAAAIIFLCVVADQEQETCVAPAELHDAVQQVQDLQESLKISEVSHNVEKSKAQAVIDELEKQKESWSSLQQTLQQKTSSLEVDMNQCNNKLAEKENELKAQASDLKAQAESVASCKNDLSTLSKTTETLKECEDKVTQMAECSHKLETCQSESANAKTAVTASLETLKNEALRKEAELKKEMAQITENLKTLEVAKQNLEVEKKSIETEKKAIESEKKAIENEKKSMETSLAKVQQESNRIKQELATASTDSYLFSADQFKRSSSKVYIVSKSVGKQLWDVIRKNLPQTLSDDAMRYYSEGKLQTLGLWKTIELKASPFSEASKPHIANVRKLYATHLSKVVDLGLQKTKQTLAVGVDKSMKYSAIAGDWIDAKVVTPILIHDPSLKALIPQSWSDRFFAVAFFAICAKVVLWVLSIVVALVGIVLYCVSRIMLFPCRCLCGKRVDKSKMTPKRKGAPVQRKLKDGEELSRSAAMDKSSPNKENKNKDAAMKPPTPVKRKL